MALINCPECGKEVSDKAPECPHCGCPKEYYVSNDATVENKEAEICEDYNCPICKTSNNYSDVTQSTGAIQRICMVCGFITTLKSTPAYEAEQKRRRENEKMQKQEQYDKTHGNPQLIKCPYCQSTSCKKIGMLNRSISASIFGLGSSKIGKQWHCNNCGSEW